PAAHRPGRRRQPHPAVRVHALRRLLRRLSGADQHPGGAGPPAAGGAQTGVRAGRHDGGVLADARPAALPVGAAGPTVGGRSAAAGRPAGTGTGRSGPPPALAVVAVDAEPGRAGTARRLLPPVVGTAMSAREEILARIRAALAAAPPGPPGGAGIESAAPADAAGDWTAGEETGPDAVLFAGRLADYRATVHRCHPADLAARLAAVLAGSDQVVVPADLPGEWLAGYRGRVLRDAAGSPVAAADLDQTGTTVVTGCAVAIAETGTIVLDAGPH